MYKDDTPRYTPSDFWKQKALAAQGSGPLPGIKQKVYAALASFSRIERIVFSTLLAIALISVIGFLSVAIRGKLSAYPQFGGNLTEGVIGTARLVHPLQAQTDAEKAINSLVFAGLTKRSSDGRVVYDLAEEIQQSDDGLAYVISLKDEAVFHNGSPVLAKDVAATIDLVKTTEFVNPWQVTWGEVEHQITGEKSLEIQLARPYGDFLQNLTLPILPAESANDTTGTQLTITGAGPYIVAGSRTQNDAITSLSTKAHKDYHLGSPFLRRVNLRLYQDEALAARHLERGRLDTIAGVRPTLLTETDEYEVMVADMARAFGLYLHPDNLQGVASPEVARAFDLAIDKNRIISNIFSGYGQTLVGPLPPHITALISQTQSDTATQSGPQITEAIDVLERQGWELQSGYTVRTRTRNGQESILSFRLTTPNTPELVAVAQHIAADLSQIGALVQVEPVSLDQLYADTLVNRSYEALLFGQSITQDADLYALWHSSQIDTPGLNIAQYINPNLDRLLTTLITTIPVRSRRETYAAIAKTLENDLPALFLYHPQFVYTVPNNLQGIDLEYVIEPNDRFAEVHRWYRETYFDLPTKQLVTQNTQ